MSIQWRVVYYETSAGDMPVRDFLDAARPSLKVKALRILMHVEEYGLQAVTSHMKKLSGTSLWEIRILGQESTRILFVTQVEKQIVLLHAFYKKTQKTPPRELSIALSRLKEYQRRERI